MVADQSIGDRSHIDGRPYEYEYAKRHRAMPRIHIDQRRLLAGLCATVLTPLAGAEAAFTRGQPIRVITGVPAGGTQDVLRAPSRRRCANRDFRVAVFD
jgi:hypothetical protein